MTMKNKFFIIVWLAGYIFVGGIAKVFSKKKQLQS